MLGFQNFFSLGGPELQFRRKWFNTFSILLVSLWPCSAQPAASSFDPAIFLRPPASYRGHAMWSFPLNALTDQYVISGIQEMARLNYGGFFIEAGGVRPGAQAAVPFLSPE